MSKKSKSFKKIEKLKLIPIITETPTVASTVEITKVLKAIISSSKDVYSFLRSDIQSKMDQNTRNTDYWKKQINYLKGVTSGSTESGKKEITQYKKFIKQNKSIVKEYKKSLSLLKKAEKHLVKGDSV